MTHTINPFFSHHLKAYFLSHLPGWCNERASSHLTHETQIHIGSKTGVSLGFVSILCFLQADRITTSLEKKAFLFFLLVPTCLASGVSWPWNSLCQGSVSGGGGSLFGLGSPRTLALWGGFGAPPLPYFILSMKVATVGGKPGPCEDCKGCIPG